MFSACRAVCKDNTTNLLTSLDFWKHHCKWCLILLLKHLLVSLVNSDYSMSPIKTNHKYHFYYYFFLFLNGDSCPLHANNSTHFIQDNLELYLGLVLCEASCADNILSSLRTVFLAFHTDRIQMLLTFLIFGKVLLC